MISFESPLTLDDLQEFALRRIEVRPKPAAQASTVGCGRNLKLGRNEVTVTGPNDPWPWEQAVTADVLQVECSRLAGHRILHLRSLLPRDGPFVGHPSTTQQDAITGLYVCRWILGRPISGETLQFQNMPRNNTYTAKNHLSQYSYESNLVSFPSHYPAFRPRSPCFCLAAIEVFVMDQTKPRYLRIFGWWVLLQNWAPWGLTSIGGLLPEQITVSERGLLAVWFVPKRRAPTKRLEIWCRTLTMSSWRTMTRSKYSAYHLDYAWRGHRILSHVARSLNDTPGICLYSSRDANASVCMKHYRVTMSPQTVEYRARSQTESIDDSVILTVNVWRNIWRSFVLLDNLTSTELRHNPFIDGNQYFIWIVSLEIQWPSREQIGSYERSLDFNNIRWGQKVREQTSIGSRPDPDMWHKSKNTTSISKFSSQTEIDDSFSWVGCKTRPTSSKNWSRSKMSGRYKPQRHWMTDRNNIHTLSLNCSECRVSDKLRNLTNFDRVRLDVTKKYWLWWLLHQSSRTSKSRHHAIYMILFPRK